jgi:WD40 repeat protein
MAENSRLTFHRGFVFLYTIYRYSLQPLRLDIKKKLSASSERVKSVDLHNSDPWVLAALYSGNVMIWDYESGSLAKSFEVSELPVRCAKFIERKQWFVAASDDMRMRVFNYNTMEKVKEFEAHADYIRSLEVHPTLPYVLSSSDDMTIKLWDWDRSFDCTQMFEGHAHYVMQVKINPKDTNTFASASLDRSIKVWGLGSHVPHYTLEGHERGVNCVDYYPSGDKPYILSGADDRTVKIWDYQVRLRCVCSMSFFVRVRTYLCSSHHLFSTFSLDEIDCPLSGRTHAQCVFRFVPSQVAHYRVCFGRWHSPRLAEYHVPR